ncbi:ERV/ALR sulfhydryl oxidase domain-containing protein [Mycena belliarum]|uniref:Sulfhydryl oxidase n=1 Tax=Mycena belliarum TaxID=1033014 RepID=A0AAD6U2Q6_9AGAR|nr:ERV/ALR sulfhydryl oxidase domain-containing protein [Mycena belliae]
MGESESSESQPKLPPGMVLGPDGKPCKACSNRAAFRAWKPPTAPKTAAAAALAAAATTPTSTRACPPDKDQLGAATWAFLHTTVAYFPERPNPTQRAHMLALLRALPALYPCAPCADDFGTDIAQNPPDVSGRAALSRWLCERHNAVNDKLGKARFDCATIVTDARWKDGPADGSCD